MSTMQLYKPSADQHEIEKLEKIINRKEKELRFYKNSADNYQKQFESFNLKANEKISKQSINVMELEFNRLKKENESLLKKIPLLKNKKLVNTKEVESYIHNKKYPFKVEILTEDMKNLVIKKHEYLARLNNNKKSIQNLKQYQQNVTNLYNSMIITNKSISVLPSEMKMIEENLMKIDKELEGNEERILTENIGLDSPLFVKESRMTIDNTIKIKRDEDKNTNTVNAVILPSISAKQVKHTLIDTGVTRFGQDSKFFKKFDFVVLRNKGNIPTGKKQVSSSNYNPHFKKRTLVKIDDKTKSELLNPNNGKYIVYSTEPNTRTKSNSRSPSPNTEFEKYEKKPHDTLVVNDWDPVLEYEDLKLEYDSTSEIEFKKLIRKMEVLMLLKEKVEKGLKEKDKIYDKKFKDIEITIKENQKKLNIFKQVYITPI